MCTSGHGMRQSTKVFVHCVLYGSLLYPLNAQSTILQHTVVEQGGLVGWIRETKGYCVVQVQPRRLTQKEIEYTMEGG